MRRNLKLMLFLSISWMFLMFYYFQSGNPKVSFYLSFRNLRFHFQNDASKSEKPKM